MSKSQRVMCWQLIIEEFGPNIHNIAGFENMVADKLSRLTSTSVNKYYPSTSKAQCCANKLFAISCCLLLFFWPPVREACPIYDVVMLQTRIGISLELVFIASCYVDMICSPAPPFPPFTQCTPGGATLS